MQATQSHAGKKGSLEEKMAGIMVTDAALKGRDHIERLPNLQ